MSWWGKLRMRRGEEEMGTSETTDLKTEKNGVERIFQKGVRQLD